MKRSAKLFMTLVVASATLVNGCAAPGGTSSTGDLTTRNLHNVVQPESSTSWFPKLPQPFASNKPKTNFEETPPQLDTFQDDGSHAGKKNKKVDPLAVARLQERRGQFETAIRIYERELASNPKKALIHHRLAVIASREGRWPQARQHFQAAQNLDPNNSELLADLGYSLYLQHQLNDAEACLKAAVAFNPRNKAAHNNLGIVLGVRGKFDESLAAFRQGGSDAGARANLGYVYMQLGDVDNALAELNQALSIDNQLRPAALALIQLNEIKKSNTPHDATMIAKEKSPPTAAPKLNSEPEIPAAFAEAVNENRVPIQLAQFESQAVESREVGLPFTQLEPAPVAPPARDSFPQEFISMESHLLRPAVEPIPAPSLKSPTTLVQPPTSVLEPRIPVLPPRSPAPASVVDTKPTPKPEPVTQSQPNEIIASAPATMYKLKVPELTPSPKKISTVTARPLSAPDSASSTVTVVPASAETSVTTPEPAQLKVAHSAPLAISARVQNPVEVYNPSVRLQRVREQDRLQEEAQNTSASNGLIKNNFVEPKIREEMISLTAEDVVVETDGLLAHSEMLHNLASENVRLGLNDSPKSKPIPTRPVNPRAIAQTVSSNAPDEFPQERIPRAEDFIPIQGRTNQLPTHQLYPTAQPTWTAHDAVIQNRGNQGPTKRSAPVRVSISAE